MIHNNFRHLIKKFLGAGNTATDSGLPTDWHYIDTDGYEGTSADTLYRLVNYVCFAAKNVTDATYSNITTSYNSTNYLGNYYILAGRTTENEPDYKLGTMLSTNLRFTTTNRRDTELTATTIINNIGETDIQFDEIGLFLHICTSASSSSATWNSKRYFNLLLIKEILDEPRVIPALSAVTITINLFGDYTIE